MVEWWSTLFRYLWFRVYHLSAIWIVLRRLNKLNNLSQWVRTLLSKNALSENKICSPANKLILIGCYIVFGEVSLHLYSTTHNQLWRHFKHSYACHWAGNDMLIWEITPSLVFSSTITWYHSRCVISHSFYLTGLFDETVRLSYLLFLRRCISDKFLFSDFFLYTG